MTADQPRRIGQYEVLGVLGKGAMGTVYKAVQPSLNRLVAIKVLPAEFAADASRLERFEREAQAVALLNHPNVVQIIDKDRDGELVYFVMEYVPGTSLDDVMRKRRLSLHEVFRVIKGICAGLEAAHRQNIVHRDLNPRNVLVSEDLSVVKLADFGISRVEAISRDQGTLSTSEISMGTLHYMSPEQASDMADVDHRTDIYSVGVTLYEMLTGRVPVGRFNLPSQLNSEVPSDVDPVVLKCLEAEPGNRYSSVGQLQAELARLEDRLKLGLVTELTGISRSTTKILRKSTRTVTHGRRRLVLLSTVGLVLIGLAAGGAWLLRREDPAGDEALAFEVAERPPEPAAEEEPETLAERLDEIEPPPAPRAAPAGAAAAQASPPAASGRAREDLAVAREKVEAGLNEPALEDLERFVAEHAGSPLLPEAYWLIALAQRNSGQLEQALATYVEIGTRFPDSKEAPAAALERARLRLASGDGQSARELFAEAAARYPEARWAVPALVAQAAIEEELKLTTDHPQLGSRVPLAALTYRNLTSGYPAAAEAESAFWRLGEIYEDLKLWELAAATYAELGSRFPATAHDAWWKAARLYDRRLDLKDRAIEAYLQVPASSRHHADAQKRANRLKG